MTRTACPGQLALFDLRPTPAPTPAPAPPRPVPPARPLTPEQWLRATQPHLDAIRAFVAAYDRPIVYATRTPCRSCPTCSSTRRLRRMQPRPGAASSLIVPRPDGDPSWAA